MATLEKIRSKSVFLIVVIGVALLAFIIGDALTNSRNLFGDHTTVAKVGSEKIDYTDYQRKREELNQRLEQARQQNPAQFVGFDTQILPQMAIDELIQEKLLDKAASRLGIRVSSDLLEYYMIQMGANPKVQQIIAQLNASGFAASTAAQAHDLIFNPKANNMTEAQAEPFQRAWIALEEETKQMIARQEYQRLVYGAVKANDLDRKALYNDQIHTLNVESAFLPFGQLDEKAYPVSDDEILKAYAEVKGEFKVAEPTKDVSFIAVTIAPSAKDVDAARSLARQAATSMRDSAGQLPKSVKKEGVTVERHNLRLSDVTAGSVKEFVAVAPKDSVKIVSENLAGFTVVRMGSRTMELDSVQMNVVQVMGADLPAKVLAKLNAGVPVDSVASMFPADSVMAQSEQWVALYTSQGRDAAVQQAQLDSLIQANGRFISLMSTPQGSVLANIAARKAPKEVVEYEQVSYKLGPSASTISEARTKLEAYLQDNPDAKAFTDNASKSGYNVQEFSLTQSSAAIPRIMGSNQYYPDSRQVVRWVMIDGEPGQVSKVYESKDAMSPALYVAAVTESYDDYAPASSKDVRAYLTDKVRREKAGDALEKQYKGKATSVAAAAQAMGVEPRTFESMRFGRNTGIYDPTALGRINGSKADKKVQVIKGQDGLYVVQVTGSKTETFPFNEQSYDQQYFQMVNPQFDQMLRGSKKFKNSAYKFEAGE